VKQRAMKLHSAAIVEDGLDAERTCRHAREEHGNLGQGLSLSAARLGDKPIEADIAMDRIEYMLTAP
jgi:hypothetical protein